MTPPYQNRGTLTPTAELWCRRMDYAERLPTWYKAPLHHKAEYAAAANTLYVKWLRGYPYEPALRG